MEEDKRNIILADFPVDQDWQFVKTLKEETGKAFDLKWVDGRASVSRLMRVLKYIFFPIGTFFKRNKYQCIITWQQFFGIMIAFYCRLFSVAKGPRIFVMTFIYRPKKGLIGKIYERWVKYAVNSKYVDKVIVYSSHEVVYYHKTLDIDLNKIQFMHLSIPLAPSLEEDLQLQSENYIFAPGKSNRDYDFLVDSLRGENYRVHIACDDYPVVDVPNVTVHHDLFDEKMYHYMCNCRCVVIPLKNLEVSSGQLVILQAMQLHKPIIVSASKAISDYVTDEVNAICINNNKQELLNALERIYNDDALCQRLTSEGYRLFNEKHSVEAMGKAMAELISN